MGKPVQRNRFKNKRNITCEECANCEYLEHGDMICSQKNDELVYEKFVPTKDYMWCGKKKFIER